MEHRISRIPLAVTPSALARPIAPRTEMLLEAPILPTLLRLAAPNVLNLLAFVGLITFDGLFVGRLGPDALAGISLVFPWVMLMQHGAASGMGGAVSSAVARALGAGQRTRANDLATHAVWLALMGVSSRSSGWRPAQRESLRRLHWDSLSMPDLQVLRCRESTSPHRRKEASHEF